MNMLPAFKLARIARLAQETLERFEELARAASEKYISGVENGRPVWKAKNSEELFEKEIKTAWEKPVDLQVKRIRLSEVMDVRISANDLVLLDWLFIYDLPGEE